MLLVPHLLLPTYHIPLTYSTKIIEWKYVLYLLYILFFVHSNITFGKIFEIITVHTYMSKNN